ncbi:hypothetical protein FVE85_6634 [Porphyridium purpureum]|uniref:Uncharacterized protein n=1 Tax=Porphyridium purpureum TaxID=35688 RepID=A0A5J4Z4W0_PORPP|nr:hypothetical protein FVE85_6634 [Porphyridium purpureum]|eukprot:POR8374..scf295_1
MEELVAAMAAAEQRATGAAAEGAAVESVSRGVGVAAVSDAAGSSAPKALTPFCELFDSAAPKLEALGVDVAALNAQILQEVDRIVDSRVSPVIDQVERSTSAVDRAASSSAQLLAGVEHDRGKLKEGVSPLEKFAQFPAQLKQLHDDILLAVKNPQLLLPSLACGGQPIDLEEAMRHVTGGGSDDAERNRDAVGTSARDQEWKAVEEMFVNASAPMKAMLPLLHEATDLFDEIGIILKPLQKLELALKQYGVLQRTSESKSAELRTFVRGLLGWESERKQIATTPNQDQNRRSTGDRALPSSDLFVKGDVRDMLGKCISRVDSLKEIYKALDSAVDLIPLCKAEFTSVFANLERALQKLGALDLAELMAKLRALKDVYPKVLETARKLCKPKGLLACVMVPSPYYERLDASVTRVQDFLDVRKEADGIAGGLERALQPLSLTQESLTSRKKQSDGSVVSRAEAENDLPEEAIGHVACGGIQSSVNDIVGAATALKQVLLSQAKLDTLDDELIDSAIRVFQKFLTDNILGGEQLGAAAEQVLAGASNFLGKLF